MGDSFQRVNESEVVSGEFLISKRSGGISWDGMF